MEDGLSSFRRVVRHKPTSPLLNTPWLSTLSLAAHLGHRADSEWSPGRCTLVCRKMSSCSTQAPRQPCHDKYKDFGNSWSGQSRPCRARSLWPWRGPPGRASHCPAWGPCRARRVGAGRAGRCRSQLHRTCSHNLSFYRGFHSWSLRCHGFFKLARLLDVEHEISSGNKLQDKVKMRLEIDSRINNIPVEANGMWRKVRTNDSRYRSS